MTPDMAHLSTADDIAAERRVSRPPEVEAALERLVSVVEVLPARERQAVHEGIVAAATTEAPSAHMVRPLLGAVAEVMEAIGLYDGGW